MRNGRKRTLAGLVILATIGASGCSGDVRDARAPEAVAEAVAAEVTQPVVPVVPVEPPPEILERTSREVGRGEPLDLVLKKLELSPAERAETIRLLDPAVDLRRILPGETVEVARAVSGELRELTLQRDRLSGVQVRWPAGEAPLVDTLLREPEVRVRQFAGELEGSLYEGVVGAGGDANLTMRYADLLAWQVDFLTETRPGDRFEILVREEWLDGERLRFGKILAAEYEGKLASARAIRYVDEAGTLDWYDDGGKSVRRAFLKSPLNFRRISSKFTARRRHPILKTVRPHWGVDYAAPTGTPVSALGDGVVTVAGRRGGYGNYIEVRHSSTYTTCYGHLSKYAKGVKKGTRVEQGEVIGYVGSTGLSTGPHLDFRVKKNGKFVDPLKLDAPAGRTIAKAGRDRFERYRDLVWELSADLAAAGAAPTEPAAWARVGAEGKAEDVMAGSSGRLPADLPATLAGAAPADDVPGGDVPGGDVPAGAAPSDESASMH